MTEIERLHHLTAELKHHSNLYYVQDAPVISDYEYDMLLRELVSLEEKYPDEKEADSPSVRVGGRALDAFVKVKHEIPMESLQDAFSFEEISSFVNRTSLDSSENNEYVVELKIDGLSASLEYRNGVFFRGLTRGNGYEGEDVTENLKTVRDIPLKLSSPVNITVRGEVYMLRSVWQSLNEAREKQGEPLFANPRNAAAGSLRQLDPKIAASRKLSIFVFNLQKSERTFETHSETLDWLKSLGFTVSPEYKKVNSAEDVISEISRLGSMRDSLPFDIDGAVVKINDLELRKKLGSTSKTPKWAIAFKYPPEEKETVVRSIEINVGRTGVLSPLAVLDPVRLAGSVVSRATLHNKDWISEKDIRVGDTVIIRKAGDIIPEIASVNLLKRPDGAVPFKMPEYCPSCGEKVVFDSEEAAIRCENSSCPAQAVRNIIHFASKEAMNIDGFGEALSERFFNLGLTKNIADIYLLKSEEIESLEGLGSKSAENLLSAIEKSKENCLSKLIYSFGIPEVGIKTAKALAAHFLTLENLMSADYDSLVSIKDIGEATAQSVIDFFSLSGNVEMIDRLVSYGVNTKYLSSASGNKLDGVTFVITGTLPTLSRDEATKLIEEQGGKVSGSVSKKTNYLLAGEDTGSKLVKANELGIKVISEEDLLKMIQ